MKSVLLKSIRISSEVCIITKPMMMLKVIKTKIYFHSIFHLKTKIYFLSIFHFSYHNPEEVHSLVLVCHAFFSLAAAKMLGIVESYQPFAFSIIQKPSI